MSGLEAFRYINDPIIDLTDNFNEFQVVKSATTPSTSSSYAPLKIPTVPGPQYVLLSLLTLILNIQRAQKMRLLMMLERKDTGIFSGAYDDEVEGVVADLTTWNSLKLVHCVPDGCEECLSVWHNRRGGTASTPIETNKALLKDEEVKDVDVHSYRSMIGSLMYLKASRPDIMFAVCACARFQVTPKVSHLYIVKRIFRYLKVVANSTTEAEYVAAANCYGQ
nr:hypothetical protein [Tanacetum cinerariifolium]